MAYFLDLFSPETYEAFSSSNKTISGFRVRQQNQASKVQPGDKFICYMTKLSRWVGILEVTSDWFKDDSPIFTEQNDPFIVRFKVKPLVWLDKEKGIPIHDDRIWNNLTFTKGHDKNSSKWTGKLRASLSKLEDRDARLLEKTILNQLKENETFEIDKADYEKYVTHKIHREDKVVSVTVPQDNGSEVEVLPEAQVEVRESIKIQALLADIGAKMGMKIWIPRNDRTAVLEEWKNNNPPILTILPLNYDETTIKTIEQIDVLWLKGRSIVRAFEVEHTTSIYSGILRMADLLALQPNMDIKLHIVAPLVRREKVFQEIRRPVFSLLEKGPLSESCTYISYDSLKELSQLKHLAHLSESVLDEYSEEAE
ncbi:MAG TPA: EVE domain-containing protein [Chloroflexia bacterium]|nr:EVE domain-containing protein [Chloroflexia bacterium]